MGREFLLTIVALLMLSLGVAAGPAKPKLIPLDVDTLVIPPASPVQFKSFDKEEITAHFAGRVTLSGTYHYGIDEQSEDWNVYLVLDPASRGLLPFWKNRPGDGTVRIDNEADFVRAVIPAQMIARLTARKSGSLTGHVSIVADNYQAMVVCDAPDYSVRFLAVATPAVASLNVASATVGC